MTVVSMMKMSGDADELSAKLREHIAPVAREVAPGHGGLGSITARTDDGIIVINLWQNEEGRHAMAADPKIQAALQGADLPEPAFEGYEVLDMVILPEAVQG